MFSLIAENQYGQRLELTNNNCYVVQSVEGIDPPDAVINTTRNAGADGSVFNSAYADNRVITITLAINEPAEANRINLYKYFKSKAKVRLFYKNDTRDVYIDGYVQTFPVGFFQKKQVAQITVFCNDPFFKNVDENITDFSAIQPAFEFPFFINEGEPIPFGEILLEQEHNIYNAGDVETGAVFIMRAIGSVTNPVIYNTITNKYFRLNMTMNEGDEIRINTQKKQKSVLLIRNGVTSNIIGNLQSGSTWLQLAPADNVFTTSATANPENLQTYAVINALFEGV